MVPSPTWTHQGDAVEPKDENVSLLENGHGDSVLSEKLNQSTSHSAKRSMMQNRVVSIISSLFLLLVRSLQDFPRTFRRFLIVLTPSYLRSRLFPETDNNASVIISGNTSHPQQQQQKIPSTAFLDGLRGVAALFVFFFHMSAMIFDSTLDGYGTPGNSYILQLPIIRLLYQGSAMVSLFFVVSGFALSIRPVKEMRKNDADKAGLLQALSSAVFRRPIRLFLPPFISTIIPFLLLRFGIYEMTRPIVDSKDPKILTGATFHVITARKFLSKEIQEWLWNMWNILEIMNDSPKDNFQPNNKYNMVVWTIPVEFRASLLLYLTHLALSNLKLRVRMFLGISLVFVAILSNRWEMILFFGGYVLAELDAIVSDPSPAGQELKAKLQTKPWFVFFCANLICGLYLASFPGKNGDITPGYKTLWYLIPETYTRKNRFWEGIGSLMIVLSVSRVPMFAEFFSVPVIRYLGQVCFALYLVHWWIIQTWGVMVFGFVYAIVGKESAFQNYVGWFISACMIATVVFWAADLFWRYVDIPCVKFAKWLESKCIRR